MENKFEWPLCYSAEDYVLQQIEVFLSKNSFAHNLSSRMREETATLFIDWVDHFIVSPNQEKPLREAGFVEDPLGESMTDYIAFHHPQALLPRILIERSAPSSDFPSSLALRVENVGDFLSAHRITAEPVGTPMSHYRLVQVAEENGAHLEAIERRGYRGYSIANPKPDEVKTLLKAKELWGTRPRSHDDDSSGFREAHALLDRIIGMVGTDLACHVVFEGERQYWQARNRAAQTQKRRQDKLGLGWANHDHHTFRSSRRHFVDLIFALEKLGFYRRERYYAGAQAGWGAQVLEQPVEGIVVFCDVDLAPQETDIDFSRNPLPNAKQLGTIGLWVGLHGESFLQAGMHHLECRFDYQLLRDQLAGEQVQSMKPFSNFPFLKQAFTEGERWPVLPKRAEKLLHDGLIDQEQFDRFLKKGAIGSHLENLQRKGGFKGFNQDAVSLIIDATDPRKNSEA